MVPLPFLKAKHVGIFGLGRAGTGALKALLASHAEIYAWDDGTSNDPAEHYEKWPWEKLELLVLSPGVPFTHPAPHPVVQLAEKHNVPVLCDIELLWRAEPEARFIGITGTNGKSTTTALIGHIVKQAGLPCEVGGNIGISALELKPLGAKGVYVIECSSYQLDLLEQARFNAAILLNITPDHLDRHGDMAGYTKAKMRIFRNQQKDDAAIIGVDEANTKKIADAFKGPAKLVKISEKDDFGLPQLKHLPGAHNRQNIAAAYAACAHIGIAHDKIIAGIKSFGGLSHRMEWVAEKNGIAFINDSKATNAEAAEKAITSYEKPLLWIAGGKPKEGGIEALAPYFKRITHAYLIGAAEEAFAETLKANNVPFTRCGELKKAVAEAYENGKVLGKATVLLSPACASWDQFKSFEDRGDQFKAMVASL